MSFPAAAPGSVASKALEAFKSGADVGAAAYGTPTPGFSSLESGQEEEHVYEKDESQPSPESSDQPEAAASTAEIDYIVSGGKKVPIDWNDKEGIKRQLQMAGGVNKLKSRHDSLEAQKRELESKHNELSEVWSTLETTFQKHGAKGVINMLAGQSDAYDKQLQTEMARAEMLKNASPAERQYLELQEALEAERKEKASILAEVKQNSERAKLDREAADRTAAESTVHPIFDKYRFAGKLGDSAAEQQLDEAIWSKAIDIIQKVPEHELTQARIDKEFRTVAATFQKLFKDQGVKRSDSIMAKKKENATAAVSAAALKGMTGAVEKESVRERIAKGDYKSSLMDVLLGKVKL